jgi:hypothetical protein
MPLAEASLYNATCSGIKSVSSSSSEEKRVFVVKAGKQTNSSPLDASLLLAVAM